MFWAEPKEGRDTDVTTRVDVANTVEMPTDLWAPLPDSMHFAGDFRFPYDCLRALIIEGVGKAVCPLVPKWSAFVIAGAVIASQTGQFITPPDPKTSGFRADLNLYIWQSLYEAIGNGVDSFSMAMLWMFFPGILYCPPERPYRESPFEEYWRDLPYEAFVSRGNLSDRLLKDRKTTFARLGREDAERVVFVAQFVPTMIEIALAEMEDYKW